MPNTSSAKKALRKNVKRRQLNRTQRSTLRTAIKKFRAAVESGDAEASGAAYREAVRKLDQAAAKRLIHKNTAARAKSRLSRHLPAQPAASTSAAPAATAPAE
ncbi:MAG: 30S ribosomal protein S20 [Planctomycetaceae bacterium]